MQPFTVNIPGLVLVHSLVFICTFCYCKQPLQDNSTKYMTKMNKGKRSSIEMWGKICNFETYSIRNLRLSFSNKSITSAFTIENTTTVVFSFLADKSLELL